MAGSIAPVPELPDIALYLEALDARVRGDRLERVRVSGPSWLRTVEPPLASVSGRRVAGLRRIGKRVVFELGGDEPDAPLFLVLHLMVAGRLHWRPRGPGTRPPAAPARRGLGALDFAAGTLLVTEASPRKRASLHLVRGEAGLAALDPGGLEPLEADLDAFAARLRAENHTVKRALTDPHVLAGVGNAYSDEILHRARLSPFKQTGRLDDAELARLFSATRTTLDEWRQRLIAEWRASGSPFPERVTAFRPGMAVHGRRGQPCPACGAPVQRIAYAENEANYCARCQTGGRLLADRALSRLLRADWPRTLDELEQRRPAAARPDAPRGAGASSGRSRPRRSARSTG
jgi:formamidopyrimidine-DNA glycosylase